jgi:hypothetical protein
VVNRFFGIKRRKVLVMVMALNMDIATPINKVMAKPLTIRAPNEPPIQ